MVGIHLRKWDGGGEQRCRGACCSRNPITTKPRRKSRPTSAWPAEIFEHVQFILRIRHPGTSHQNHTATHLFTAHPSHYSIPTNRHHTCYQSPRSAQKRRRRTLPNQAVAPNHQQPTTLCQAYANAQMGCMGKEGCCCVANGNRIVKGVGVVQKVADAGWEDKEVGEVGVLILCCLRRKSVRDTAVLRSRARNDLPFAKTHVQ